MKRNKWLNGHTRRGLLRSRLSVVGLRQPTWVSARLNKRKKRKNYLLRQPCEGGPRRRLRAGCWGGRGPNDYLISRGWKKRKKIGPGKRQRRGTIIYDGIKELGSHRTPSIENTLGYGTVWGHKSTMALHIRPRTLEIGLRGPKWGGGDILPDTAFM